MSVAVSTELVGMWYLFVLFSIPRCLYVVLKSGSKFVTTPCASTPLLNVLESLDACGKPLSASWKDRCLEPMEGAFCRSEGGANISEVRRSNWTVFLVISEGLGFSV